MLRKILEVSRLCKDFNGPAGAIHALRQVSFSLREGTTLGVVGESGSGKSTLARCLLRLVEPDSGLVRFDGEDITYLSQMELRPYRKQIQMVFQNPYAALNPRMTIGDNLMDPLRIWNMKGESGGLDLVRKWLDRVGLQGRSLNNYPWQFSGGQLQRINIARALIVEPRLLICDEAVSSLDISVQAQILSLLGSLQREFNLSMVFISHDLGVIEALSDEVMVMYQGEVVEQSTCDEVYRFPKHDYTKQLVGAMMRLPTVAELRAR